MANENLTQEQLREIEAKRKEKFTITTRSGDKLFLDKPTVQKYLTNNVEITDSEFNNFFQLCKANKVNPFLKEAYIVKYGSDPATIVIDYKVLQMSAELNPAFVGMKTGVIVMDKDGNAKEREGGFVLPNETLVAGWCEVSRNDRQTPTKCYAMLSEFRQVKKDGTPNKNWAGKPTFMIIKVAKAQALREAFPNMFGTNLYTEDEVATFDEKSNERKYQDTKQVQDVVENNAGTKEVKNPFKETKSVKEDVIDVEVVETTHAKVEDDPFEDLMGYVD